MNLIEILILSIIQGLTEWLPVSSSGHLVIAQKILGLDVPLIFDVMLHFGTLIVVVMIFRKEVKNIIRAFVKRDFENEEGKLAKFIIVGSIPIAVTGLFFHDFIESLFSNLLAVGLALLFTGSLLFVSEKRLGNNRLDIVDSLLIGLAQAVAIIPGISRSGLTISTGLLRKIDKATVFRYSFLLYIPAVIGATIVESRELVLGRIEIAPLLLGTILSMIVSYVSLKLLQKIVMHKKLHLFAYYCWTVGLVLILFLIIQ